MSNVVEQIGLFQKKLDKYSATNETDKLLYYIHKLKQLNIRVSHLEVTGVGRTVNALRQQHKGIVADKAKALVNKWKDLLTEEDEEEEYEAEEEEEEEEYDGHQPDPVHPVPHVPEAREYATEDQESDNGGEEEEEEEDDGRLQIEEDQDYPDNHHGYSPTETKTNRGYSYQPQQHYDSDSGQEDSYNPLTSQRDYLRQSGPVSNEYHPSSCSRVDSPDAPSSPQWKDTSSDRKNGTSPRASSSKKSSKGDKERSKDKERNKDKGKDKYKESSRSHEKEKKKERKEKHKHRDKEEKKEEKKSHKDKHREKDTHSEKVKEKKHKSEDYNEKPPQLDTPDERYMANGFSSPEVEERSYSNKKELRESDKRGMDEKRKAKSDKSIIIASKKDDSSHRDNNTSSVHKEDRLSDDREGDRTDKYSGREKENIGSSSSGSGSKDKGREKKREERHRDKDRSKSDKKERHSKESEDRKLVDDKSKSSSKDKVKKKSKAEEDIGFGAALMGLDSPVKKKKKKKKKEVERERESSDDEKPSTSSSSNKRVLADDGEQSSPKKPKLLALSPQKLPKLPSFVQDDAPFLPEITPNYKPLPRVVVRDEVDPSSAKMTDEEALNFMFQSKNKKRSKMYSGKASGLSYVPSLYEICIRVLQDNIDALEVTGGIPFDILRPVLERADPRQLMALEDYNSYLLEDTNVLWEVHCKRDFRNKRLEEMETCRDMWIRLSEERDFKLKSITQNLQKKFVSNSEPKRTTKLAFVDTIIKVPKSVARAQAKYGTAPTSAAAIVAAANPTKANEAAARKTAMLNVQRAERATPARPIAAKKRVAPLMAKTRQFYKKAFRR